MRLPELIEGRLVERRSLFVAEVALAGGDRAVQLFFIQRCDCDSFRPADDIDPEYSAELRRAAAAGVTILVLQARITKHSITIRRPITVEL